MSHIKFRKLNKFAMIPARGSDGAAGFDLCANLSRDDVEGFNPEEGLTVCSVAAGARQLIATGISMEIPHGFFGMIKPRSGLAAKHGIGIMAGVIDSDYRGDVRVLLINHSFRAFNVKHGDRIAQIIFMPYVMDAIEVHEASETERGDGGFGSTGQ